MKVVRVLVRMPLLLAVAFAMALILGACGRADEAVPIVLPAVAVTSVELGTAIDESDLHIVAPATVFAPHDMIHASVTTTGPGLDGDEVRMDADWVDQNGTVIFHSSHKGLAGASKPDLVSASQPNGFAPGNYQLEIKLDGALAATKEFTVK